MNYYDWMEQSHPCRHCGWQGPGKDRALLESFRECAEYGCPKCGEKLGVVAFPTHAEVKADPRADIADRMVVEIQETRWEQHEATKLKSPEQLPDLDSDAIHLLWDEDGAQESDNVLIKFGERVIWNEMAFYENYLRFEEIASILHQKYGKALKDLEPTKMSWLYLYGDSLNASEFVERIRDEIRAGFRGPAA